MGLKIITLVYEMRMDFLPNRPRDECAFDTTSGKASFTVHDLPDLAVSNDRFVLMTIRSHDQYNTTIYGLHDRYRGVHGNRRILFMNAIDMSEMGLKTRDSVDITSYYQKRNDTQNIGLLFHMKFLRGI